MENEKVEEMIMVPVAKQDAAKVYELSEAAMIARNVHLTAKIKSERQKLFDEANIIPATPKK